MKPAGRGIELTPSGPWVKPDRVDEDDGQDLLEGDRHHREIVAAQAQRREAEPRAGRESDRHAPEEAEPKRQVIVDRAESDAIGAEREKRGLREIDLTAQSEHDRQAEDRDRVGRRLHQNVGDVAVGLDGRGERHQNGCEERVDELSDRGAAHLRPFPPLARRRCLAVER